MKKSKGNEYTDNMKKTLVGLTAFASMLMATSVIHAETYEVQEGDTLSKIAAEKNTTVEKLVELNKLTDPNFVLPGQQLEVGEETPAPAASEEVTYQASAQAPVQAVASQQPAPVIAPATGGVVLANGNTAGEHGAYAAARMAEMTGVPASTWEHIIARESNGQVNASNGSGASGLFQTMPGWGSTATVDDQIQAAYNAYSAQGMSAWGY